MDIIKEYTTSAQLPDEWDNKTTDNIYLRRDFLQFTEGLSNVMNQRYYAFWNKNSAVVSKFTLFSIPDYSIFQFTNFAIHMATRFVYVPLSVSKPGIVLHAQNNNQFFDFIRSLKGLTFIFNLPQEIQSKAFTQVATCPRCVLHIRWDSFDTYMQSLRSNYRNRYKKAIQRSANLNIFKLTNNSDFSEELYGLYLQVHSRARYKVETLHIDFFRGSQFTTFVVTAPDNKPIAFFQLLANGKELIFEFAGLDYASAPQYVVYTRILLEIVKYGIENNFERIDFGQTAEDAKLKIGCIYEKIYILAYHSNPVFNFLLRIASPLLQYTPPVRDGAFTVFNNQQKNT